MELGGEFEEMPGGHGGALRAALAREAVPIAAENHAFLGVPYHELMVGMRADVEVVDIHRFPRAPSSIAEGQLP